MSTTAEHVTSNDEKAHEAITFEKAFPAHLHQLTKAIESRNHVALLWVLGYIATLVGGASAIEIVKHVIYQIDFAAFQLQPADGIVLAIWAFFVTNSALFLGSSHVDTLNTEVRTIEGAMHQYAARWNLDGGNPQESIKNMLNKFVEE